MRRAVVSALLLTLLLGACATPQEPTPAPPEPVREAPQPPPAMPVATRHSEADDVLTYLQGRTAQQAISDASTFFAPGCVRLSQAPKGELLLITTRCRDGEHPDYLAWKGRSLWRISALQIGEARITRFLRIALVNDVAIPDVFLVGENNEGALSLVHAWREGTGELITQAVTQPYKSGRFTFRSPTVVQVDYGEGKQVVLEWDGAWFKEKAATSN